MARAPFDGVNPLLLQVLQVVSDLEQMVESHRETIKSQEETIAARDQTIQGLTQALAQQTRPPLSVVVDERAADDEGVG